MHKDIRRSMRHLFPDHMGGPAHRHIHGKVVMSKRGVFMVTSESTGFRGKKYVVRKVENNSDDGGRVTANPVFTSRWGHLAMDKMIELAGGVRKV